MASISISGWSGSGGRSYTLNVWENSYNAINNTSNIGWSLVSDGGGGSWYDYYLYASVGGTVVYNESGSWSKGSFPASTGSISGSFDVSHNADGTKSISLYIEGYAFTYSTYSNSGTLVLTNLDRTAPTVSLGAITNIGVNSFSISASSNVSCDTWQYSLNGGTSWTTFKEGAGTSASTTISGLTVNTTYTVYVRARKVLNYIYGTSGSRSAKTLGYSEITSASNITLGNNCSITWTPLDSSFKFDLVFSYGTWNHTTGYITPRRTTAYTYTGYALPLNNIAVLMTNKASDSIAVTLRTYKSDGTLIGSSTTKYFTGSIPASIVPSFTYNLAGFDADFLEWVTQLTSLTVNFSNVAGNLGSTVKQAIITVGGETYAYKGSISSSFSITTNPFQTAQDDVPINIKITDTRDRIAEYNTTIDVKEYYEPKISDFDLSIAGNVARCEVDCEVAPLEYKAVTPPFVYGFISITKINIATEVETSVLPRTSLENFYKSRSQGGYGGYVEQQIADITSTTYNFIAVVEDIKTDVSFEKSSGIICISKLAGGKGVTFGEEASQEGLIARLWDSVFKSVHSLGNTEIDGNATISGLLTTINATISSLLTSAQATITGLFTANGVEYPSSEELTELAWDLADEYSSLKTYEVGIFCIRVSGQFEQLYECNTAITSPESWNSSHWTGIAFRIRSN